MAQTKPSYEDLQLSEEDIKVRYITPAILSKDWSVKDITMESKVKAHTRETWFYRLDMPEGYKHFSKTKPMQLAHCKPISDWWNNRAEIIDAESGDEKSRRFSAKTLFEDLGLNFDQCKFPKEEEEVLRPEELLQQYHAQRTALEQNIDQTLAEIQRILGIESIASIEPIESIETIATIYPSKTEKDHGKG